MSSRKKIRDFVVDLLTNKTDADARVYGNRFRAAFKQELPMIIVYALKEEIGIYQESPREYERNLALRVEILAKADEALDDAMDDIADDIEYWMHQDHAKNDGTEDLVRDTILQSVECTIVVEGETQIGSCVMTYLMPYYTFAVADDSDLDDFAQFDMKIQQPSTPSGQFDSEDLVTVSGA